MLARRSATGFGRWGNRKSRLTCPSRGRRGSLYVGRAPREGGRSSSHRRSTSGWRRSPPSTAPAKALRWRQTRRAGRRWSDFSSSLSPSSSARRRRASRTTSVLVNPSLSSSVSRYARSASVSRKAVAWRWPPFDKYKQRIATQALGAPAPPALTETRRSSPRWACPNGFEHLNTTPGGRRTRAREGAGGRKVASAMPSDGGARRGCSPGMSSPRVGEADALPSAPRRASRPPVVQELEQVRRQVLHVKNAIATNLQVHEPLPKA